jgi:hypothetical protein
MSGNLSPIGSVPVPGAERFQDTSNLSKESLVAKLFKDMRPTLEHFYLRALGEDVNSPAGAQLKTKLRGLSDVEFQRVVQGTLYVSAYRDPYGEGKWNIEVVELGTFRKLEIAVEPTDEGVQLRLNKWPEVASPIRDNRSNNREMTGWNTNPYIPGFPLPNPLSPRNREKIIEQMAERGLPGIYADRLLGLIENHDPASFYNPDGSVNEEKFGLHLNLLLDMTLPWVLGKLGDSSRGGRGQSQMPTDAEIRSFLGAVAKEFNACKTELCNIEVADGLREGSVPKPQEPKDIPQPGGGAFNPHVYLALQKRLNELGIQFSFSRMEFEAIAKYIARNTNDIEDANAILNKVFEMSGGKLGVGEAQGIIKQWHFSDQNGLPNWAQIVDGIQTTIDGRKILSRFDFVP